MNRLLLSLLILTSLLTACTHDKPPVRIVEFVAYKEGADAVRAYVVLADQNGQPIAADGTFLLTFTCNQKDGKGKRTLYIYNVHVKAEDFKPAPAGTKLLQRKELVYSFGHIPYIWFTGGGPAFDRSPETLSRSGEVAIEFTDYNESGLTTYLKAIHSMSY